MVLDPRGYKTTIWSGLGMILVGVAIAILGYFGAMEDQEIHDKGIQTPAAIMEKGVDSDRDNPRYFFNLRFADRQSGQHKATRTVDKASWEARNIGESVDVRYLESNPAKVRMVAELGDPIGLMYWLGGIGAALALTGVGFIVYARKLRPGLPVRDRQKMTSEVNH